MYSMNTESFVETTKKHGHTFTTTVTVERTPATLSEHRARRGRWFDFVGDHVTECHQVKVTLSTYEETYFEIVTPSGRGIVMSFQGGDELVAFIPNTGKALITGCWKKYGSYRGHGVAYMRGNRLNVNSKAKVDHTCCARLYAVAAGKPWGV